MKKASPSFDKEKVSVYINFFTEEVKKINEAQISETHKEVLYICVLDSLSKTIYPKNSEHRKKFSLFIRNFSDWPHWSKISLPHLVRLLVKSPQPEFSDLRRFAYGELSKWQEGSVIYLDKEPDYEKIKELWPKRNDYPKAIEGVSIEHLRHDNLLYKYRNSLVHELNRPGYGIDMGKFDAPCYHTMSHGDDKVTWELLYPIKFFKTLCDKILKNLNVYYEQNLIDPYSFYNFGTYWIKELN